MTDEPSVEVPASEEKPEVEPEAPAAEDNPDVAKLEATNKQLFERAKKAEDQNKKFRQVLDEAKPEEAPKEPTASPDVPNLDAMRDEISQELRLEVKGYNAEEIAFIKRNARDDLSLPEVAEGAVIQAGIKALREAAKAEQATPAPSPRKADIPEPNAPAPSKPQTFADIAKQRAGEGAHSMKSMEQWKADRRAKDSEE